MFTRIIVVLLFSLVLIMSGCSTFKEKEDWTRYDGTTSLELKKVANDYFEYYRTFRTDNDPAFADNRAGAIITLVGLRSELNVEQTNHPILIESGIEDLKRKLRSNGLTYKDIGTSNEEMEALRNATMFRYYITLVKKVDGWTKTGLTNLDTGNEWMEKDKITPDDVKTDLNNWMSKGYRDHSPTTEDRKMFSLTLLVHLRSMENTTPRHKVVVSKKIDDLRKQLDLGSLTYEDIGTSNEKMRELMFRINSRYTNAYGNL